MGGADKGLLALQGQPLVAWVLERLAGQADPVLVNANRHQDQYAAWGHEVVPDRFPDFAGPLAGIAAGLERTRSELLLVSPCDTPWLPRDLAQRLRAGLGEQAAAVAQTYGRLQPVHCLLRQALLPDLLRFLGRGGRQVEQWFAELPLARVDFNDVADAFLGANSPAELERLASIARG